MSSLSTKKDYAPHLSNNTNEVEQVIESDCLDINNESSSSTHLLSPMPIWIDNTHLSPKWLEAKMNMKANSIKSCIAKDVSNQNRKGSNNNDGATIRIFVTLYNDDDHEGDNSSTTTKNKKMKSNNFSYSFSVIIKQTIMHQHQTVSKKLGLTREAYFYNQLKEVKLPKEIIPKVYYSYGDFDKTGEKCIIMEDLNDDLSCIDSGILFGKGNPNNWKRDVKDMIDKAFLHNQQNATSPMIIPSSKEVALTTFREIAKIHALYWKNENLLTREKIWLRGQEWLQGKGKDSWEASQTIARTLWKKYLDEEQQVKIDNNTNKDNNNKSSGNNGHLIKWDATLRAVVEKAMNGISWNDQLKRLNTEGHWTLVHGDFWPGNVMWMIKNDKNVDDSEHTNEVSSVRFLDWEMVGLGSGPQDLGQYVISNMDPTERKACERELIESYVDELKKHINHIDNQSIIDSITWDYCWHEYKVGAVERWIWFLVYFLGNGLADWAQYFHDQLCSFIHDHEITASDISQPRP